MDWTNDSIIEWYDIARKEHISQKGMNYGINPNYSIILMSRGDNAPYNDYIYPDGIMKNILSMIDSPLIIPTIFSLIASTKYWFRPADSGLFYDIIFI